MTNNSKLGDPDLRSARFAYISEVDISVDNGRGINEREFVRTLLEQDDEVVCVLPQPQDLTKYQHPRIEYVLPHRHAGSRYVPHLLDAFRALAKLHRQNPIDALIVRLEVTPLIAYLAHRMLGIPIILKTLAVYQLYDQATGWRQSPHILASRFFRPMFRSVIQSALAADTVSPTLARWIETTFRIPGDRLRVVPNGANLGEFSPGDRLESKRALGLGRFRSLAGYVGVLSNERHVDALIRSFARIPSSVGMGLILVGDGPGRPSLEALARAEGVAERVVFTGAIPYSEVPSHMRAFNIGVDLSLVPLTLKHGSVSSSFSQKIAQYLGCALPVVAWDIEDTRFLQEDGIGRLARFRDERQLGSCLEELAGLNSDEQAAIGERARSYAEKHRSNVRLTQERVEWWRSLLDRHQPRTRRSA